jgi:hypothetical protein
LSFAHVCRTKEEINSFDIDHSTVTPFVNNSGTLGAMSEVHDSPLL